MKPTLSDGDLRLRADLLQPLLPTPSRRESLPNGGYSLVGGVPPRVVVRLTPAGLRVGPAKVRPWGQRGVLVEGRLAAASWGELPSDDIGLVAVVGPLTAVAAAMNPPTAAQKHNAMAEPSGAAVGAPIRGAPPDLEVENP